MLVRTRLRLRASGSGANSLPSLREIVSCRRNAAIFRRCVTFSPALPTVARSAWRRVDAGFICDCAPRAATSVAAISLPGSTPPSTIMRPRIRSSSASSRMRTGAIATRMICLSNRHLHQPTHNARVLSSGVIPSERSESRNRSRPDTEPFGEDDRDSSTMALRAFARNDRL